MKTHLQIFQDLRTKLEKVDRKLQTTVSAAAFNKLTKERERLQMEIDEVLEWAKR